MMGFAADGSMVVVSDGFGLTRLTLPTTTPKKAAAKLKTEKVHGALQAVGPGVVVAEHGAMSTRVLRTMADLKPHAIEADYAVKSGALAWLDDERLVIVDSSGFAMVRTATSSASSIMLPAERNAAALDPGRCVPSGPAPGSKTISTDAVRVAARAGVLAVLDPHSGDLIVVDVDNNTATRRACGLPAAIHRVAVVPHDDGVAVCVVVQRPSVTQARVITIVGERVYSHDVPTALLPSVGFGRIVTWVPGAVVAYDVVTGAEVSRKATRHALAALTHHGERVIGLSDDHEAFVDVSDDTRIDRKLPEGERATRDAFRAMLAPSRQAARAVDVEFTAWCRVKGEQHEQGYGWALHRPSLVQALVAGDLLHRAMTTNWGPAGYSRPTSLLPIDDDDVTAALAWAQVHRIDLLAAAGFLDSTLTQRPPRPGIAPTATPSAAQRLLVAMLQPLTATTPTLPLTPSGLIAAFDPASDAPSWRTGQQTALLLLIEAFAADAAPVFVDWLVTRRSAYVRYNAHICAQAVTQFLTRFAEAEPVLNASGLVR